MCIPVFPPLCSGRAAPRWVLSLGPQRRASPGLILCDPLGERRKGPRRQWVMGKVEVGRSRGLFGLGHMSTGSEEVEVCPAKALSILDPSASAWIYLLSSQSSCLAHNPVLRMPGPGWGQGLTSLLGSSSLGKEGGSGQGLWASRPWSRGSSLVASGSNSRAVS